MTWLGGACWIAFLLIALPLAAAADRQLGPSSRRTPLTITEIHYHPSGVAADRIEFVELFNTEPVAVDLTGYRLRGEADFVFPTGAVLPGLSFLVVAAEPQTLAAQHAITNVLGPFTNRLSDAGGTLRLDNRWGAVLLEISYDDDPPWPVASDGAGHSLVLGRPDYGEASPLAWTASRWPGGSPGRADPTNQSTLLGVVINEILAHTDPDLDRLELYNTATQPIDLSGCSVCDDPAAECFTFPPGTLLPAGEFLGLSELDLGFRLNGAGDDVFLVAPGGSAVLDAVRFGAQARGVSIGRYPDGAADLRPMMQPTLGSANTNTSPRRSPVIINELMFHPLSGVAGDEYVEVFNRSTGAVDISGWQFSDGVRFVFPAGSTLAPGSYLVVARDRDRLIAHRLNLNAANTLGNFSGELSDRGERVTLAKPDNPALPLRDLVVMDSVTYGDGEEWGAWIDGGGSSLELTDPDADGRFSGNWAGSDESQKALWTTIEHTGVLDNGSGTLEELDVYLMNEGECLVDNIECIRQGETVNRVGPATFEAGLDGWTPLGNHLRSAREAGIGDGGGAALHVRASGAGRTTTSSYLLGQLDRIWKPVTPVPVPGETYTIRARARWLCGWPFLGVSVKGFWLEAAGALHVPANLGTPGLPNSRLLSNAPPAITELEHVPVLPAAGEAVTIFCGVDDSDGLATVALHYRLDPATNYITLAMTREGPGGTGRFHATIPGQAAGTLVGFYVSASDAAIPSAVRAWPAEELLRNALVRFGEPSPSGVFGTYAYWVSDANVKALASRSNQSNEPVDATFVYNGSRVIYNAQLRYRGNFRRFSSITNAAYALEYPGGERFLGDRESKIDIPSLQFSNGTRQQERHSYTMAAAIGYPASHLRYCRTRVNGAELFRHDLQAPTRDFAESWYGDSDAFIHKEEKPLDPFAVYDTTGGVKKQSTYAFIMQRNRTATPDYNYEALYHLVDALAQTNAFPYVARTSALADLRDWCAYFAMNRAAGNEDSYGYGASFLHNLYAYLPARARSHLQLYDMDSAFTAPTTDLFPDGNYPIVQRLLRTPAVERVYWAVLQDLVAGPMRAEASDAQLDAWYGAFTQDGLAFNSPDAIDPNTGVSMRQWIADRRALIAGQLSVTNASVAFALIGSSGTDFATTNAIVTLSGVAPVAAEMIQVNGLPLRCEWLTPILWQARLGLQPGANPLQFAALDRFAVARGTDTVTITYAGPAVTPVGRVCLSEIMYHPRVPRAEFIECFNRSFTEAVDLGGSWLEGVDFVFPHGSIIAPRGRLVVGESVPGYAATYINAEVLAGAFGGNLADEGEWLRLFAPAAGSNAASLVDAVPYDDAFPWPASAAGAGGALQRIDLDQSGEHPGNWRAIGLDSNAGWTYVVISGVATSASPPIIAQGELSFYADGPGEILIDRIALVTGSVAEVGANRVQNGDFEGLSLGPWVAVDNHARSRIVTGTGASGAQALALTATDAGVASSRAVKQGALGLIANRPYTLSFWYFATHGAPGLNVVLSQTSLRRAQGTEPPPPALALATPGAANAGAMVLPLLPAIWINEVMPLNAGSALDNVGEAEPWIELWNTSTARLELAGLYLGTNVTAPLEWALPSGAFAEPGAPVLIWADAETNESESGVLHAGFRLSPTVGTVVLALDHGGQAVVLDALAYANVPADSSLGSVRDGDSSQRQGFPSPTPGTSNGESPPPLPVRINEWMADNTVIPDPVDGRKQDWFELFNPNPHALNLGGYRLTDTAADFAPFIVPDNQWISGQGFLMVWADNETEQTQPQALHVDFRLNNDGDQIALSDPAGRPVDTVTFGAQLENRSEGRWPDGDGVRHAMLEPTPGDTNRVLQIQAATTTTNRALVISFASVSGQVYRLEGAGVLAPTNWVPLGVATAAGVQASVEDSAAGAVTQRFYRIQPVP